MCVHNAFFPNKFTEFNEKDRGLSSLSLSVFLPVLSEGRRGEVGSQARKFTSKCNPVTSRELSYPENAPAAGGEIKKKRKKKGGGGDNEG